MCDFPARAPRGRRNNLAWLLATNPDPTVRDGTQAVKLASWAAAYAEAGNFKEAIAAAEQGLRLTDASRDKGLVDQLQTHLTFYRAGRPWRE